MATAAITHAVLVDKPHPELLDDIAAFADLLSVPRRLPVVLISSDGRRADAIRRVPGVLHVSETDDLSARIAGGIDTVLHEALAAMATVVEPGTADSDGYPRWRPDADPPVVFDEKVRLHNRRAAPCVLNLSWGVGPGDPFVPSDPVNVATRAAASWFPIVVAAGNWSDGAKETISAWAEAPWVISVGATMAPDGGPLLASSSRGSPRQVGTGPTVVAYGASALDEKCRGTSYAAPRVTRELITLAAWCLTFRHLLAMARGGVLEAIPPAGIGIVDAGFAKDSARRSLPLRSLPAAGVDPVSVAKLSALIANEPLNLHAWPTPSRLRRMLIESARPLEGLGRHEQGAGFIGPQETFRYLHGLTGADALRIFGPQHGVSTPLQTAAASLHLTTDDADLPWATLWNHSALRWYVDLEL